VMEGLPHLRSGLRKLLRRRRDRRRLEAVMRSGSPYFLLPLQVHNDSQVTEHSPFLSVADLVTTAIRSFAAHAPLDAMLLVKHHPLDRGHCNYRDVIERAAGVLGCAGRVVYFTEGHLPSLLDGAAGTVTCNSTVGLSSLCHGTPVKALGRAVYNRPGLTAQCPLDQFWSAPQPVNRDNVLAFTGFLRATCQANGSFYTGYRRTGVLDAVIARMAGQYALALSRPAVAQSRSLPVTSGRTREETWRSLVSVRLFSPGEGAE
ncbi:MAG: hypothetical protein IMF05_13640, partial [Proteobacteria bacterium]|nr:hypothetical protein [Pseudomonadota bacterium]